MFIKMPIVLSTIFSMSLLHCMEPEQPILKASTKKLIKQKSQAILRKLSNEKINEEPTINTINLEHQFITAVHNVVQSKNEDKDYTAVQFHLKNPYFDPNITDQQGYSALQIFIQAKACTGINLLLTDHRVHFKNKDLFKKIHAFECIDKSTEASQILRQKIFARITLDEAIDKKYQGIKSVYIAGKLTQEVLTGMIECIKTSAQLDNAKQNEAQENNDANPALPKLTGNLPDYATNEFIEKKIWFILSSAQNNI